MALILSGIFVLTIAHEKRMREYMKQHVIKIDVHLNQPELLT